MQFIFREKNRDKYPQKHILVCEDDLHQVALLSKHFSKMFEHQGLVQFSFVPGGLHGQLGEDLVIPDHTYIDLV